MKRLDDDYIALTNNEARELQKALAAAENCVDQFAVLREIYSYTKDDMTQARSANKLFKKLRSWRNRIHRVWSSFIKETNGQK